MPPVQKNGELEQRGIGYTIATGRLMCSVAEFHKAAEEILGRPVYTHEFADERLWERLRSSFEAQVLAELEPVS